MEQSRLEEVFKRLANVYNRQRQEPPVGELPSLLVRLEEALRGARVPVSAALSPGADVALIAGRMEQLGLDAPPDLLTWFGWHNGLEPTSADWFAPGMRIADFDTVAERYADFDLRYLANSAESRAWFPVVLTSDASTVVMNCNKESPGFGRVTLRNELGEIGAEDAFPTLAMPIEWCCEAIEGGLWVVDEDGGYHPVYRYEDLAKLPGAMATSGFF